TIAPICVGGVVQNVNLFIGTKSFPMAPAGDGRFSVSLNIPGDLESNKIAFDMSASFTCGGRADSNTIGQGTMCYTSGPITDALTGVPVVGASVKLYRVADALPDTNGKNGDCRTMATRSGADWSGEPVASLDAGTAIDPLLDVINDTLQVSPLINPQITGS